MNAPRAPFLISLPWVGSILLQRILAVYPEVSTAEEAWLLLPWIYALRGLEERVPNLRQRIFRRCGR